MIIDKITNIEKYIQIPVSIHEFIKNLSKETLCGKYNISDTDYVNIETYNTKQIDNAKFETHDKYIDIQLLLQGQERIYFADRVNLQEDKPYNIEKDITFYSNYVGNSDYLTLDSTNFVMIFPHEAHAPQVSSSGNLTEVKKAVFKIKI